MAAAAIASGAVALPVEGGAAGASMETIIGAIVTATASGVVREEAPLGCAAAAASPAETEISPEDGLSADFAVAAFSPLDFVLADPWTASVLALSVALAAASEVCLARASRLSEAFAAWSGEPASRERA